MCIRDRLTEQLELDKKQWEEVMPVAEIQYTDDTHTPADEPDTAQ